MEEEAAADGKYRRDDSELDRGMDDGLAGSLVFFFFSCLSRPLPLKPETPARSSALHRSRTFKDVRPQRLKERRTLLL